MGGPLPVVIGLVGGPGFGGESRRGLGMEPWGCGVGKSALGPLPGGSGWWSGKGTPSRDDKHTRRGRGCPSITPTRRLLTMGSGSKRPRVPREVRGPLSAPLRLSCPGAIACPRWRPARPRGMVIGSHSRSASTFGRVGHPRPTGFGARGRKVRYPCTSLVTILANLDA